MLRATYQSRVPRSSQSPLCARRPEIQGLSVPLACNLMITKNQPKMDVLGSIQNITISETSVGLT